MKNSTAQSGFASNGKIAAGNSHGECRHKLGGAHGIVKRAIEASRPGEYILDGDSHSRKWRVRLQRRHALAIYLAGYSACYPGLKRIARDLGWSRRTVCTVMAELKLLGVMVPQGYVAEHGTRLRTLNPAALHSFSRESCTPARRESCTQEVPKKFHRKEEDRGDTAAKTAAVSSHLPLIQKQNTPSRTWVRHTPQSAFDAAVRIFRSPARFEMDEEDARGLAYWIAYRCMRASGHCPLTTTYYMKSAENFFMQYDQPQGESLIEMGADRYAYEVERLESEKKRAR